MRPSLPLALLLTAACGASPAAEPDEPSAPYVDTWIIAPREARPARPRVVLIVPADGSAPAEAAAAAPAELAAPSFVPERRDGSSGVRPNVPRRRIDLSLREAEPSDAFRLLAEAGGFDLVVADGVTGHVSITLRKADPFDALVTIAHGRGAQVAVQGRRVVVTPRR